MQCLAKRDENGYLTEFFEYHNRVSGEVYYGIQKNVDSSVMIDVSKQMTLMINAVLSKADYEVARKLSQHYGVKLTFVGHDQKVYKSGNSKDLAGDIDSLFTSDHIDFLVERTRTVGDGIVNQVTQIRDAYQANLISTGSAKTAVSIVFAEAIDETYVEMLLKANVIVMYDSIVTRYSDDYRVKNKN